MSEVDAAEIVPGPGPVQEFDPRAALRSVGLSLTVSGILPFAIYKLLEPHFAQGSVKPLLFASAFPLIGLAYNYVRTRAVDAIAIIALFGISYSVVTTVLAGEVRMALILGATQGVVIALVFFLSALMGKPVLFFISRQFVAGNDPARRAGFAAVDEADGGRTFFIATMVWAVGVAFLTAVSLALAMTMEPATYLLVNNALNVAVNVVLLIWTIRFTRTRLTRVREQVGI